jgi:hypothetical protein
MAIEVGHYQAAGWVEAPGADAHITIKRDIPIPTPANDEVLVKLQCTGVWSEYLAYILVCRKSLMMSTAIQI